VSDEKAPGALRTIGETSVATGVAQHVLRYWETRFPQLRPITRAGNRRYYRPEDVALVERINRLLSHDGYTVKGVQKLLAGEGKGAAAVPARDPAEGLRAIRNRLQRALDAA
jgi:DNA-binding transcriptional MerR regulator